MRDAFLPPEIEAELAWLLDTEDKRDRFLEQHRAEARQRVERARRIVLRARRLHAGEG